MNLQEEKNLLRITKKKKIKNTTKTSVTTFSNRQSRISQKLDFSITEFITIVEC